MGCPIRKACVCVCVGGGGGGGGGCCPLKTIRQDFGLGRSSNSFAMFKWLSTKGADCCPSAVVFRFVVGKKTSSVWQNAAARFYSAGNDPA